MTDFVDVVLRKCDDALMRVEAAYERDVAALVLSDELLYDIRGMVQDCQSALDATATRVRDKYLTKTNWSPYFPLATDAADFASKIEKSMKGITGTAPAVVAAFERHQPYQAGSAALGHLHVLSRVNKHRDFSEQLRTTTPQMHIEGGKVIGEINGKPVVLSQDLVINLVGPENMSVMPVAQHTTARILVGWNFVDPPVGVLPTLRDLARQTRDAVEDIHQEAAL